MRTLAKTPSRCQNADADAVLFAISSQQRALRVCSSYPENISGLVFFHPHKDVAETLPQHSAACCWEAGCFDKCFHSFFLHLASTNTVTLSATISFIHTYTHLVRFSSIVYFRLFHFRIQSLICWLEARASCRRQSIFGSNGTVELKSTLASATLTTLRRLVTRRASVYNMTPA